MNFKLKISPRSKRWRDGKGREGKGREGKRRDLSCRAVLSYTLHEHFNPKRPQLLTTEERAEENVRYFFWFGAIYRAHQFHTVHSIVYFHSHQSYHRHSTLSDCIRSEGLQRLVRLLHSITTVLATPGQYVQRDGKGHVYHCVSLVHSSNRISVLPPPPFPHTLY